MISAFECEETESIATSSRRVCSTVILVWSAPACRRFGLEFRLQAVLRMSLLSPPQGVTPNSSTPQSLLQLIEALNDFFLHEVLPFRDDWLAADNNFADCRTRCRKDYA